MFQFLQHLQNILQDPQWICYELQNDIMTAYILHQIPLDNNQITHNSTSYHIYISLTLDFYVIHPGAQWGRGVILG